MMLLILDPETTKQDIHNGFSHQFVRSCDLGAAKSNKHHHTLVGVVRPNVVRFPVGNRPRSCHNCIIYSSAGDPRAKARRAVANAWDVSF
jgi:hypothetical protein